MNKNFKPNVQNVQIAVSPV